jgi:chemotaxis protein histidine kinase CheA
VANNNDDIPGIDPEILARAEQAVAALGGDFIDQTKEALDAHRNHLDQTAGLPSVDEAHEIFSFAHDLRGQGGSFGYPLLSEIGGSLCHFLEAREFQLIDGDKVVIHSHFDAAAAILADEIAGDGDTVSQALVAGLLELVVRRLQGKT